jgi:hypothetical protein
MTPYENALNLWLAAHAHPDEMILPPIDPRSELQSKTGHPVLMESETLQLLTYMPSLSPVIAAMARDLYGIDYANAGQLRQLASNNRLPTDSPVWIGAWQKRGLDEWQSLGQKYGFRLVLSPTRTPLHLQAVLPGPVWTLYEIN